MLAFQVNLIQYADPVRVGELREDIELHYCSPDR